VFLAIAQVGIVNRWMTGVVWRSPYQFGDEGFQSLKWSCPHWPHVLFDTFHGLLPTHPLVGVGLIAVVVLIAVSLVRRSMPEAAFWTLSVLAVAVNLYSQGAWFYWWLAACPCVFGMRGLVLAAIPAIVGLIRLVALLSAADPRERANHGGDTRSAFSAPADALSRSESQVRFSDVPRSVIRRAILLLAGACLVWSWLLLSQGPMDYLCWSALWEGQVLELGYWMGEGALVWVAAGCVTAAMLRERLRTAGRMLGVLTWLAATLAVVYVADRHHEHLPPLLVWYAVVAGVFLVCSLPADRHLDVLGRLSRSVLPCILFAGMVISFLPLAIRTRASVTDPQEVPHVLFHAEDVRNAHDTLALIPRLESQRQAIATFLERQKGARWCADHLQQAGAEPRVLLATKARAGDLKCRSRRTFLKRH